MMDLLILAVCIYSLLVLILLMAFGWTVEFATALLTVTLAAMFGSFIGRLLAMIGPL